MTAINNGIINSTGGGGGGGGGALHKNWRELYPVSSIKQKQKNSGLEKTWY